MIVIQERSGKSSPLLFRFNRLLNVPGNWDRYTADHQCNVPFQLESVRAVEVRRSRSRSKMVPGSRMIVQDRIVHCRDNPRVEVHIAVRDWERIPLTFSDVVSWAQPKTMTLAG